MLERLVGMEYWSEVESHALSENVGYFAIHSDNMPGYI